MRLRLPEHFLKNKKFFISSIEGSALVRELHIYGPAASLGEKGKVQHKGLGRALLEKAENIAKHYGAKKIAVISGVGVRDYYRRQGYELVKEGEYMVKELN